MFVEASDVLIHTVAFGPPDAPPPALIALSGWSASWQAWAPTFEHLSGARRCLAYDTRGTAGSPCDPSAVTFDALVDDVFRVLDAHAVDRCILAGESLGGLVALHAALRVPDRFHHLVLVGAPSAIGPSSSSLLVDGARSDYAATIAAFTRRCLNEPGAERLWPWGRALFRGADPECAARLLECSHGRQADPALIRIPTTIVQGVHDLVVSPDIGRHLAATIPGATYAELDAGHAPTVTQPRALARLISAADPPKPHPEKLSV